jgi:PKD repeat protein
MLRKTSILTLLIFSFLIGKSQFTVVINSSITAGCPSLVIPFTSYSAPTTATSWHWDFGDGDTSNIQNPTHIYSTSGVYDVTLIASDGIDTDTLTRLNYISVYPVPIPNFTHTLNGLTATFIDQSSGASLWSRSFGDNTFSSVQNPIHLYNFSSDTCYDVVQQVTNIFGCVDTINKLNLICVTDIKELNTKNISVYPTLVINHSIKITGEVNDIKNIIGYDILGNQINTPIISKNTTEIILETNNLKKGSYTLQLFFKNDVPMIRRIIVQ